MAIEIVSPGLATTVQDLGRPGYYHLGIPLSGGMDRLALQAANLLVGNDPGAAVLEAVFMGPQNARDSTGIMLVSGARSAVDPGRTDDFERRLRPAADRHRRLDDSHSRIQRGLGEAAHVRRGIGPWSSCLRRR